MQSMMRSMVRPKQIFRYEAILPITLLVILGTLYTLFLMDGHIKKTLEWSLGKAVGAEVSIDMLNSDIYNGTLLVKELEITNANKPSHNSIAFQTIELAVSWDALLRGKVVITTANITNIALDTPRKKPGKVYPKEPSKLANAVKKVQDQTLQDGKATYRNTAIGDLVTLLENKGDTVFLAQFEDTLESKKQLTRLKNQITETQEHWQTATDTISNPLTELQQQFSDLQKISFGSIEDATQWLSKANALKKRIDEEQKKIATHANTLSQDINALGQSTTKISKAIETDTRNIGKYIQLPELSGDKMTQYLLTTYMGSYIGYYKTAKNWAATYMPPNLLHTKTKTNMAAHQRNKGTLYTFGKQNSYPRFWLKQAKISSVPSRKNPNIGALEGQVSNFSTNQALTQRPFEGHFSGEFPKQDISHIAIHFRSDRRTRPTDILSLTIRDYPISKMAILDTPELRLSVDHAMSSIHMEATKTDQSINLMWRQKFKDALFDVNAQNTLLNEILQKTFADITETEINANGIEKKNGLDISIHSPLGNRVSQSLSQAIDQRLQSEKKALEDTIAKQLDQELTRAKTQITAINSTYSGLLDTQKEALSGIETEIAQQEKEARSSINRWQTDASDKINSEKQKLLDAAKKQLPGTLKKLF
jgi:uncharacterized protein (TIGR03545 family)